MTADIIQGLNGERISITLQRCSQCNLTDYAEVEQKLNLTPQKLTSNWVKVHLLR